MSLSLLTCSPSPPTPPPPRPPRTKPDPPSLEFKVPPTILHQTSSSRTQILPQFPQLQELFLPRFHSPAPTLCRSHPAAVGNALPPPWPGKGSPEGSGVGLEAISWWGRRGHSQVPLPLAPSLPSLALPWGPSSRSSAGSRPPPSPASV